MALVDLAPLERLAAHLDTIADLDRQADLVEPLLLRLETVLRDDNERGLLAGLDCNDQPMPPTQRETHQHSAWRTIKGRRVLVALATPPKAGDQGPIRHRKGGGKPLVPRGTQSRAIANARTAHGRLGPRSYFAALAWHAFDSDAGAPILAYHRTASGAPYPVRDVMSRPRPTAVGLAKKSLREWGEQLLQYKA